MDYRDHPSRFDSHWGEHNSSVF
uniref:Uncharacterized protein n=1 Tax=Arundo donax TaxID=35708 RepID=A0A0A9GT16_ARUDO